ncbi:MAG: hypothetical protein ACHQM6_07835, partial [Candidatus Kapaibacterium sp.]
GRCKMYSVFEIFKCSLSKGHGGPHEGALQTFYVLIDIVPCHGHDPDPAPPKDKIKPLDEVTKIPTKEEADKADAGGGPPAEPGPCPYIEKTHLRTVAGSWRLKEKSKESHGVSLHPTGGSWAGTDATWERDIWNVFLVKHCTLLEGHGGAHKLDGGSVEYEKAMTITVDVHYDVHQDQVPPKDSSDGLPQEDPPKK